MYFSCGSHWVEGSVAISSPRHGVCLFTDIGVLRKGESSGQNVTLPTVFKAPIWLGIIVNFVHTDLCRINRHPCAVSELAGHQTGAKSWGPGRAVAWIPSIQWVGLIPLARVLWEVRATGATCVYQPKPGAVNTAAWTQHRSDMPSALPWLPQPYQHCPSLMVIVWRRFLNFFGGWK